MTRAYAGHSAGDDDRAQGQVLARRLADERTLTQAQVARLRRDLEASIEASTSVATDDEHDPEGATIAFERAQVAALLDQARRHLADLDRALERLAAGVYGYCEQCERAIGAERLAARPAARTCITCASAAARA